MGIKMSKMDLKNMKLGTKIEILKEFLKELNLKPKKFNAEYISCFRTLNSLSRYPYYWDLTTATNAKFIQFLLMTKILLKRFDTVDMENLKYIIDNYLPSKTKSLITIYMIFKTYNKHREELAGIKFPIKKVDVDEFKEYMDMMEIQELENTKKLLKKNKKKSEQLKEMSTLW